VRTRHGPVGQADRDVLRARGAVAVELNTNRFPAAGLIWVIRDDPRASEQDL
jgi:hypothetical protein